MKKLFILFFALQLSIHLKSQDTLKYFVNGVSLDTINSEYRQIIGTNKFLSTKLNIQLDFGQYNSIWKNSDTELKNNLGKKIELNSMIDALNFMVKNGYEYVDSYIVTVNSQFIYYYLLRKIKKE